MEEIFGVGKIPYISRIHTAYYIGQDSSIFLLPEMFGDKRRDW